MAARRQPEAQPSEIVARKVLNVGTGGLAFRGVGKVVGAMAIQSRWDMSGASFECFFQVTRR